MIPARQNRGAWRRNASASPPQSLKRASRTSNCLSRRLPGNIGIRSGRIARREAAQIPIESGIDAKKRLEYRKNCQLLAR